MATFPIVKGTRLRATKINSCGLPIAGPANYLVTDGFVTATVSAVMKDAEELEQTNAEGKVCVSDRTPPERKYYTTEIELCNVNTGLITMFNGWEQVLDWDDVPVGFRDQAEVEGDYGVALEIWTGGKAEDDCPTPANDSIFSAASSGKSYGYLLIGATEFTLGDVEIGAQVSTLTLSGISVAMPQWGRGPWNVAATDAEGTPGRLLTPLNNKSHFTMFRTPVAPPAITPGANPCPLAISTVFAAPNYYFGGPANEPAADIAPAQAACVGN
ncbi:major tail protein [Gordonia phage BiggityBass]|nr:major tail protein [Gordonia phage BiggityBass]